MSIVHITGTLPPAMAEGSRADDWAGLLSLDLLVLGSIASVELVGAGADYVAPRYDAALSALFLGPCAVADYEAFAAAGTAPEIAFSLRVHLANGTVVDDPAVFRIGVLDVDDTPPQALGFTASGSVAAGAIGAVIGTLVVTDPDSRPGSFHFTFAPEDEWRFEVVDGTTLKLKEGISLGLDDIPARPVVVEVSDGHGSAGFVLDIAVADPAVPLPGPAVMTAGETQDGVALASTERAVVVQDARSLVVLQPLDSGGAAPPPQQLTLADGTDALVPADVTRVEFTDGLLDRDPEGLAAQAASLHRASRGEVPGGAALARDLAALEAGAAPSDLASAGGTSDVALAATAPDHDSFVARLFHNALGRAPTAEEVAMHLARLASGTSEAQLTADVALGADSLARLAADCPGGLWAALPAGRDVADTMHDLPPWTPPLEAGASLPGFAADLLLV
jgi:hypothetical protein